MIIFTFLLCVFVNEVKSQTNDIVPARILASQFILSENSDLHLRCSTFGSKKHTEVFVHLCHNGIGVAKQIQKQDEYDTAFTINGVTPKNSGNYSCVYSQKEYESSAVNANGNNIIEIQIIENFHPANLSLSGSTTVTQGAQIEFICSLPYVLHTLRDCAIVQANLMRDGVIYQVHGFDVERMETRFVVQDAVRRDSGQYSCVVRPSQCFEEDGERLTGNNVVPLRVKEAFPLGLTLSSIVALMLLLGIGLWKMHRRDGDTSRAKGPQINDAVELQRHTEREGQSFDEQDDSYDSHDELGSSGYQNVETGADPIYSDANDFVPFYDEVLSSEGPSNGNPGEPKYSKCYKNK